MKIICTKDYDAMSRYAADRIAEEIMEKRGVVLGLATGTSPLGIYKNLAEDYAGNKNVNTYIFEKNHVDVEHTYIDGTK